MPQENTEIENITLGEVTSKNPSLIYARCINAQNRPADHCGDWPVEGVIYPVYLVHSRMEGIPLLHVLTFRGEKPYFNAFSGERFEILSAHAVGIVKLKRLLPIYLN